MKQNYTHMILILDESGSMGNLQDATIEGINSLVEKQKQDPGDFTSSLYKFNQHVTKVGTFSHLDRTTYNPMGTTSLFDAVCEAIDTEGKLLEEKPEAERPDKVVVVIVTDGHENSSRKNSLFQVQDRIDLQQKTYNWKFVFLGANIDAFTASASYGIPARTTMQWTPTYDGVKSMYSQVSSTMTLYKAGGALDFASQNTPNTNNTIS